jgi:hypothetical protein
MKIYKFEFDYHNYKSMRFCDDKLMVEYLQRFDGTSLKDNWKITDIEEFEEDKNLLFGDVSKFHIPVLNKKSFDILYPLIKDNIEVLPMRYKEEDVYGINVLTVLDALDYELADFIPFPNTNRAMLFKKYAFLPEVIAENNIFKIINETRGYAFVSETFYNVVEENGLQGFDLQLVYDSEIDINHMKNKELPNRYNYNEELDSETMKEIIDNYRYALNKFNILKDDTKKAIKQLFDVVEKKTYHSLIPDAYDDVEDATVALGVLFGQFVCDSYGWKWRAVGDSEDKNYISIVSPNEYFCLFPLHYMNKIVSGENIGLDGENDNTIILLYNMLANVEDNPKGMKLIPLG